MRIAGIAALAVFLAAPMFVHAQMPAAKNDKAAQEVIAFRNRYIEAEENRDTAFLDKILMDDFFALNPQGKLLDKAGQLENLKRPDRTLKVLNPRETHVQFYANGDVAVLTEHVTSTERIRASHSAGNIDSCGYLQSRMGIGRLCWRRDRPCPVSQRLLNKLVSAQLKVGTTKPTSLLGRLRRFGVRQAGC